MATLLARLQGRTAEDATTEMIPNVDLLTPEGGRALFDRRSRKLLNISGEEFLRRWDTGKYRPVQDNAEGREVGELIMMLHFARRTKP